MEISSLTADAVAVLETSDPFEKATLATVLRSRWQTTDDLSHSSAIPPRRPSRPDRPLLLAPGKVPRRRINRGIKGRVALLHALAHIELNAVDLACDIIARFGQHEDLPGAFFIDWIGVASDEGRHFLSLSERLKTLGPRTATFQRMTDCGKPQKILPMISWRASLSYPWYWRPGA